MNTHFFKIILVIFTLSISSLSFAKEASIKILSPADGATLLQSAKNRINFEATPGIKGDHLHLYVNDKDPVVLQQLNGQYTFPKLEAGNKDICLKMVDKYHTPIGVDKCIKVKVE